MGRMIKIDKKDFDEVFQSTTRQYYVGNLKKPQLIEHIKDERLEIGVSNYSKPTIEPAHKHSIATEYQYVIEGVTEYLDVESNEIYHFEKGDFYAIFPNTSYYQKTSAETKILFIKVPSINDKELVEVTIAQQKWANEDL